MNLAASCLVLAVELKRVSRLPFVPDINRFIRSRLCVSPSPFQFSSSPVMAVNRIQRAFAVPKKGETFELRAGLVSQYAWERKESIQKTIMAMTLGKDVSALFPDVLKNIATGDLDQKKLVYLYLM